MISSHLCLAWSLVNILCDVKFFSHLCPLGKHDLKPFIYLGFNTLKTAIQIIKQLRLGGIKILVNIYMTMAKFSAGYVIMVLDGEVLMLFSTKLISIKGSFVGSDSIRPTRVCSRFDVYACTKEDGTTLTTWNDILII